MAPTDFVRAPRAVPLRLLAGKGHHEAVIAAIAQAQHSVWIATANLKELMIEDVAARPGQRRGRRGGYRSILALFDELVGRGVEIRILHASPPSRPFATEHKRHPRLKSEASGFELRLCPRVHLKTVVIDGAQLYLGSANFTGAGLGVRGEGRRNFELGILSDDDVLLDEVQALFDHLWNGQPCQDCKLRSICPAPIAGVPSAPTSPGGRAKTRRPARAPGARRRPSKVL